MSFSYIIDPTPSCCDNCGADVIRICELVVNFDKRYFCYDCSVKMLMELAEIIKKIDGESS